MRAAILALLLAACELPLPLRIRVTDPEITGAELELLAEGASRWSQVERGAIASISRGEESRQSGVVNVRRRHDCSMSSKKARMVNRVRSGVLEMCPADAIKGGEGGYVNLVAHELGHAIGLAHTSARDVMNANAGAFADELPITDAQAAYVRERVREEQHK